MAELTHLDAAGHARMVDVGDKGVSRRRAVATGRIRLSAVALAAVTAGNAPKGDVLAAARIAGIMAAKRTADLIPLCHPLPIASVEIGFDIEAEAIAVRSEVTVTGRTGVEIEALTAVTVALLTIYDMLKAIDRTMVIEGVRVLSKGGGRSGDWTAAE